MKLSDFGPHFIYLTTNLINGKIYVGKRKVKDNKEDSWYLGSGIFISRSIEKYGKENFSRIIIEFCTDDNVNEREKVRIREFDSTNPNVGYNLSIGGDGGGYVLSAHPNEEEIRKKLSAATSGKNNPMYGVHRKGPEVPFYGHTHTQEAKNKISKVHKGKKLSNEHIQAIIIYQKGRKKTEEHKHKISQSHKGKILSEETKEKISHNSEHLYTYRIIDPLGNEHIINNLNRFCKENGLTQTCMQQVVSGKCNHHKGWMGETLKTKEKK